jgi:ribose 5-phosphate isomerase B
MAIARGLRVAVGADHAGVDLKDHLAKWLAEQGAVVVDVGTHGKDSVDYPDFAGAVSDAVLGSRADRGLLVCGTGIGMSMAANRRRGIRAAACSDTFSARMAREHNDANVLCIGARVVGVGLAEDLVRAFLEAAFEGGRHQRRVDKIEAR